METLKRIAKWLKVVPAFFWGAVVAIIAALGIWHSRRAEAAHKAALDRIARDADADRADSDRLVKDKDTGGMRDKWLDPENWT